MRIKYPIETLEFESLKPRKDSVAILVLNNKRVFKKNTAVINLPINRHINNFLPNHIGVWRIKNLK